MPGRAVGLEADANSPVCARLMHSDFHGDVAGAASYLNIDEAIFGGPARDGRPPSW